MIKEFVDAMKAVAMEDLLDAALENKSIYFAADVALPPRFPLLRQKLESSGVDVRVSVSMQPGTMMTVRHPSFEFDVPMTTKPPTNGFAPGG